MAAESTNNNASGSDGDGRPPWINVPFLDLSSSSNDASKDNNSSPTSSSSALIPNSDFEDAYGSFQALHIRGFVAPRSEKDSSSSKNKCAAGKFQASDVQPLFESLNDQDEESWCIENEANHRPQEEEEEETAQNTMAPSDFLDVNNKNQRGYCSFLVQHSKRVMENLFRNRLPMVHLPVANSDARPATEDGVMTVHYGPCLWLFFGKNYNAIEDGMKSPTSIQGRPEHTDSVTHDGTWHYQLSGTKIWRLRPTTELMRRIKERNKQETVQRETSLSGTKRKIDSANHDNCSNDEASETNDIECAGESKKYIEVECKQGDILLLNTRLWWHSTLIPPQDVPCISYARDVYFPSSKTDSDSCNSDEEEKQNNKQEQSSSMTNIDGTYAAEDITAETVLFTEQTMPGCELHRSKTNPNCQVVELEDEETGESYMAVVSMRDIKAGEFFCILESDTEESEEDDDGESDSEGGEMEEWEEEES